MKYFKPLLPLIAFIFVSCSTIAGYDQASYDHAVKCKVDALALMDKAKDSYSDHTKDIEDFQKEFDYAYEYDKGRGLNYISIQIWNHLRDPNKPLLGGFLTKWKAKDHLSSKYIELKKVQVGRIFDDITSLEQGKSHEGAQ